jgi:excinuclease UvrABC nuclease subunit
MRREGRRRLTEEIRETVPRAPGVYAFLDAHGQSLYIGKSVNLRQRMSSYFSQDPLAAEPHVGRMVAGVRSFAWWQTRSELLALLLEDVMIKEHMPPLNTRQREFAENRYLEMTNGEYPACLIVGHADDFGARQVYGPLKDKYFAATLQGILHEALGIRTCSEPEPVGRCLDHDIGRCAGPCRGALSAGAYRDIVEQARDFLRGNAEAVLERLSSARDGAAAARRFEEAARLRDAIDTCRRYDAHKRFAQRFEDGECRFHCAEDGLEYHFARGALVAPRVVIVERGKSRRWVDSSRIGLDPEAAEHRAVAALQRPPSGDRRFLADRARIVCNWARRRRDRSPVRCFTADIL